MGYQHYTPSTSYIGLLSPNNGADKEIERAEENKRCHRREEIAARAKKVGGEKKMYGDIWAHDEPIDSAFVGGKLLGKTPTPSSEDIIALTLKHLTSPKSVPGREKLPIFKRPIKSFHLGPPGAS